MMHRGEVSLELPNRDPFFCAEPEQNPRDRSMPISGIGQGGRRFDIQILSNLHHAGGSVTRRAAGNRCSTTRFVRTGPPNV